MKEFKLELRMATCSIDIRLKRASKEFSEGDVIGGDIIVTSSSNAPIHHSGIFLYLDGMVNINLSTKNVGVFEAFYNSAKVKTNHTMMMIFQVLT